MNNHRPQHPQPDPARAMAGEDLRRAPGTGLDHHIEELLDVITPSSTCYYGPQPARPPLTGRARPACRPPDSTPLLSHALAMDLLDQAVASGYTQKRFSTVRATCFHEVQEPRLRRVPAMRLLIGQPELVVASTAVGRGPSLLARCRAKSRPAPLGGGEVPQAATGRSPG